MIEQVESVKPANPVYWWTMLILVVVVGIFLYAFPINDSDFFWHLEAGKVIADTRSIPHQDTFSFTSPGVKWVTHEWLFELVTWLVFAAGSYPALCILRIIFLLAIVLIPLLMLRRTGISPFWLLILLGYRHDYSHASNRLASACHDHAIVLRVYIFAGEFYRATLQYPVAAPAVNDTLGKLAFRDAVRNTAGSVLHGLRVFRQG